VVPLEEWEWTRDTLQRWSQIVGKVRLRHEPPPNRWWHVALYLTPRGLTTSLVPHASGGLEIDLSTTGSGSDMSTVASGRWFG
jgi:hypothetical protein